MTHDEALIKLTPHGQARLLRFWDALDAAQRENLLAQIERLDFTIIAEMRKILLSDPQKTRADADMKPAEVLELSPAQRAQARVLGEAELRSGKVGALLVAGGQGTRLGISIPKGAMDIGPVSDTSLFYYHSRRILAMSKRHDTRIPFYIMTSDANHADTLAFFESRRYFGLPREDVFFFKQGMWPAFTPEGEIILETPSRISMGPDGHGGTIAALKNSGALDDMVKRQLATLFYFQVDNPLVEIADPVFIGAHLQANADYSLKVCAKRDPEEGLGVVAQRDGQYEMIEYTELSDRQKNQRAPDNQLYYKYGSVGIHVFSLAFLIEQAGLDMPLHIARKAIPCVDENGVTQNTKDKNKIKFEKFIFDLLPRAKRVVCLAFDRAEEFSPVKNAEGEDSPATCRRDLTAKNARILASAGVKFPFISDDQIKFHIELDPCLALFPDELKKRIY